ncbi:type II toxin-antitoxin system RnlB family antitoxin [Peribacillus muralis]|uniref:type II toxin-antitoxin system RnlB family antitoxin n=1 Tax=Peribacillus muralis TaxID=264697 RepID=UPI00366EDDBB
MIYKYYMANVTDIARHLDDDFSGRILIDTIFSNCKNSDRFVEVCVENGEPVRESLAFVQIDRNTELRVLSNRTSPKILIALVPTRCCPSEKNAIEGHFNLIHPSYR